jgi:hypothetical protein
MPDALMEGEKIADHILTINRMQKPKIGGGDTA